MPIPRLHRDRTLFLLIDVQERLLPTIHEGTALVQNCGIAFDVARQLALPTIVTEQYVRGLGPSAEPIARRIEAGGSTGPTGVLRVEKTRFSAAVPEVQRACDVCRASAVLVAGVEAHVCVLQTALDLLASGRQVFLLGDAISSGAAHLVEPAFERMRAAGAVVSDVLGAAYELLGDAADPAFRGVLQHVKALAPLRHER